MNRLTTDNPGGNFEAMMNFAYAENRRVILSYANGEEAVDLCDYVAYLANKRGCDATPESIMEGGCMECDCEVAVLNVLAIQAAELRERLKAYEDTGRDPGQVRDLAKQLTASEAARADLGRRLAAAKQELARHKDAVPVVHGRWEEKFFTNDRQRVCSVCHCTVRQPSYDKFETALFKYCPHCRAKMDGGDGDA